jgi:regulatory protein
VPVLTEIRAMRQGSKQRQLVLDGEPWRMASSEALALSGIEIGVEADPAQLEARLAEVEPVAARERAFRLLTYKERSTAVLVQRLEDDGYPRDVARAVVADLVRIGLVDDDRFAHMLARNVTQVRGIGRSRALRELTAAGIDPQLAEAAVDEALPPDAELDAARRLADAASRRAGATVDKVASRLLRRGYRPAVALSVAREAIDAAGRASSDDFAEAVDAEPPDQDCLT